MQIGVMKQLQAAFVASSQSASANFSMWGKHLKYEHLCQHCHFSTSDVIILHHSVAWHMCMKHHETRSSAILESCCCYGHWHHYLQHQHCAIAVKMKQPIMSLPAASHMTSSINSEMCRALCRKCDTVNNSTTLGIYPRITQTVKEGIQLWKTFARTSWKQLSTEQQGHRNDWCMMYAPQAL